MKQHLHPAPPHTHLVPSPMHSPAPPPRAVPCRAPQVSLERRLLEEAREARRREREDFITEVSTERRRLAQEYSDTQRQLDAARSELLMLKTR